MKPKRIKGLYYITHIDNLPSILKRGILSHERIETENIAFTPIYDKGIVQNRRDILTPSGKTLWNFANFYFQPRNPMLYRVLHEKSADKIAIVSVIPSLLERDDIHISTGNAAHSLSEILIASGGKKKIPQIIKDTVNVEWWREEDGSKRRIMAECLIPDYLSPALIQTIYVATHSTKEKVEASIKSSSIPVIFEPTMFFLPLRGYSVAPKLYLVEGDMFFSKNQTITISVNTVGVMGKGLASRAKYQFPDVYVYYQDLCRARKLKIGRPQLYKRETSLDYELADEPQSLPNGNLEKWFLLFPTKKTWKENSSLSGIEEGLKWLANNYKSEGIKSLAVPALGCGLGKLDWRDVGPLMCKYLVKFDINVAIYLPTEKKIPKEFLSKEFLLS